MSGIAMVETEQQNGAPDRCDAPEVSVVVPLYNEADNVEPLCHDIREALDPAGLDYEVLLVDDGSRDETLARAEKAIEGDERFKAIELRRNFGQAAALQAGFDLSRGANVVAMDGDRQNDPQDIPRLIDKLEEQPGYDVVSGWRKERKDNLLRRIPSWLANRLISSITGVKLHDYGCSLKAYRSEVLDEINLYGEMHRFIPALIRWVGGRVTEMPVNHRYRTAGESKYGLNRTFRVLLDLVTVKFMTGYMTNPLYFFGGAGFITAFLSFVTLLVVVVQKLEYGSDMTGNPLLYLCVTFSIITIQIILMGLMMEMLVRTYYESQGRSSYHVRKIHRGEKKQQDKRQQ